MNLNGTAKILLTVSLLLPFSTNVTANQTANVNVNIGISSGGYFIENISSEEIFTNLQNFAAELPSHHIYLEPPSKIERINSSSKEPQIMYNILFLDDQSSHQIVKSDEKRDKGIFKIKFDKDSLGIIPDKENNNWYDQISYEIVVTTSINVLVLN